MELLLAKGANFEHRNVSDYTPLSLAASGGYVIIIKLLLRAGADINSRYVHVHGYSNNYGIYIALMIQLNKFHFELALFPCLVNNCVLLKTEQVLQLP